ncbi:MAG TPA: hypothetical protein PK292_10285 [Termitinemataceae bacterium]|nr:hypothetical protein [Termitinemataceae bacterium]
MAKRPPAIYEPGELDRIRQKLGPLDPEEARQLAQKLGGEVGVEKTYIPQREHPHRKGREETVSVSVKGSAPRHRVEVIEQEDETKGWRKSKKNPSSASEDDPTKTFHLSYRERVKMDRWASDVTFEIKSPIQVLFSILSVFKDPPDLVYHRFVTERMNEYYSKLEALVTAVRSLLPRNNVHRNEAFRLRYPFAYQVMDTLRYWNIELITSELGRLQAHPRTVQVSDFSDILKAFYRPIILLEQLDIEHHVKPLFKILYTFLYQENPQEAQQKHQAMVRKALVNYPLVMKNIRYLLYPLLMKLLSDRWFDYEDFFKWRKNRIYHFLQIKESDRLSPPEPEDLGPQEPKGKEENTSTDTVMEEEDIPSLVKESDQNSQKAEASPETTSAHSTQEGPGETIEKSAVSSVEALPRAVNKGLDTLGHLFPGIPWQRLAEYPDLYPYFSRVFDFRRGYELIHPRDPMLHIAVLMHILEELFYGLRYVRFGIINTEHTDPARIDDTISRIITNWHEYIERILEKDYLHRLDEYNEALTTASDSRSSSFTKRLLLEINWIKRLYFLPYHTFDSFGPPPFNRNEITPIYSEVHSLKKILTLVAADIEEAIKKGGAEKQVTCSTLDNPWEPYVFQIPNPLSVRLDALLGGKKSRKKTNAALIFFTIAVVTVLDHIMNNQQSWAYSEKTAGPLRSAEEELSEGLSALASPDPEALFKESLKNRESPAE